MKYKHLVCVAFFSFLASSGITLAQTQTTKATKKPAPVVGKSHLQELPFTDARNRTVILSYAPPGGQSQPYGSGVWIGKKGYIVTCWHVISKAPESFKIGLARDPYVTEGNINLNVRVADLINIEVVAHDEDTDIAILKAATPPDKVQLQPLVAFFGPGAPPAPITPQRPIAPTGAALKIEFPQPGQTLLLAGFPLGQDILVLQTGVATGFYSVQQNPNTNPRPSKALRLMLSLVSNPGNSGGPVFDADGKVVGLLEGNLESPIRDAQNRQVYSPTVKFDANGQAMRDATNQLLYDITPLTANSGISYAVPARFIAELAHNNGINLE